ncbi:MAG: class B sortase [Candidatus Saccharibacteria bacterium]|nr:class B sortase [Candidatus Saccharibacteria bacterium]
MKIRKAKSRIKIAASCVIALICVVGIGYSGYKIYEWTLDSIDTDEQTSMINEAATTREISDNDDTQVISSGEPDDAPYWKYLKTNLLDVDFSELRKINDETAGWISLSGTNINYPYVQTTNNDFYLKHSFDKSYNTAGWVFEDFRNKNDGSDKNLILYAHGRNDGSMFGTLRTILTNGWRNNSNNFVVRTANDSEMALWQVFSVYRIPVTTDYIQTSFSSDAQFEKFITMLKDRSVQDFGATVSGKDQILTLSTCYNSKERVVLHAKLIKRQAK